MDENQGTEEIVEVEETDVVEKRGCSKGAIVAAIAAAGVGIACGVKWLFSQLGNREIDYVEIEDEDDVEEIEYEEVDISLTD